ncbi:thiol:disulfide interchange protein DsbG [Stenotrophomonas lactitubi]|uniref:Thiol:disulfide interchange protein n=1 Tax=Stenotrophomonas lactitubi TaxID=2045214 RepID=A0AAW4GID8_9GAMM|nr:thiol:disulfide interchange protein DsbG [Stenotrophomonas lactitubi]MBM9922831.1 thiol:disulfide interchange protein DsbG [Stenotrophomonas lactitubi]MBM9938677.1 thiol:disulfide interchange protein DsbG [Stenotrophomonas lactitubi]
MSLASCTQAEGASKPPAVTRPAVLAALERQGVSVAAEFDASSEVRAYAGSINQQPMAIYVMGDGSAVVGTRLGPDGKPVDEEKIQKLVLKPMSEAVWSKLAASTWVQDGSPDAPRIVYAFGDANCPYCHKFWEAARPWVKSGRVQIRHVMVGIIKEDSAAKAAAILGAKEPEAALNINEMHADKGGIRPLASIPPKVNEQLQKNALLMVELGFSGTPGILYKDASDVVQRTNGMPPPQALEAILGPRP